jgi:hypothetical protein
MDKEAMMAGKEISVKKYVVRLNAEGRQPLELLIREDKGPVGGCLRPRLELNRLTAAY